MKELLKLINDDYQTRGANYPKSNIPDSIAVTIKDENVTVVFFLTET